MLQATACTLAICVSCAQSAPGPESLGVVITGSTKGFGFALAQVSCSFVAIKTSQPICICSYVNTASTITGS